MASDGTYILTTNNTTDPFTLAEVNEHLKESFASFFSEPYLISIIRAVKEYGEQFTRRIFLNKVFTVYFTGWKPSWEIRRSKLISITSIKYIDENKITQTVSSSNYAITFNDDYATLYFDEDFNFPNVTSNNPQPVFVEFIAGYGALESDIPSKIKMAMLQHLALLWKHRGDCRVKGFSSRFIEKHLPDSSQLIYSMERIPDILL